MNYKLIESDGSTFDIEDSADKVIMRYSKDDGNWTEKCRGKVAASITCDGNGLKISISEKKFTKYLDYGVAGNLLQALKAWEKLHPHAFSKYRLYKEID